MFGGRGGEDGGRRRKVRVHNGFVLFVIAVLRVRVFSRRVRVERTFVESLYLPAARPILRVARRYVCFAALAHYLVRHRLPPL